MLGKKGREYQSIRCKQTVRPIRMGFCVSTSKVRSVREAIGFNTCLWGGMYNPLIPINGIGHSKDKLAGLEDLIRGFDIDILVNLTEEAVPNKIVAAFGNRLITREKFLEEKKQRQFFKWGLSIAPALYNYSLYHIRRPESANKGFYPGKTNDAKLRLFAETLWGFYPKEVWVDFEDQYCSSTQASKSDPTLSNMIGRERDRFSPIEFSAYDLNCSRGYGGYSSHVVYVGDYTKLNDLVDFWNIRAAGCRLVFVPTSAYRQTLKVLKKFIPAGNYKINENIVNRVDIQKSISISESSFEEVLTWLKDQKCGQSVARTWKPRWSGREAPLFTLEDESQVGTPVNTSSDQELTLAGKSLAPIKVQRPSFLEGRPPSSDHKLWAVDLDVAQSWDNEYFTALPNGDVFRFLARYRYSYGKEEDLRLGRRGITAFIDPLDSTIRLNPITVEEVFRNFFSNAKFKILQNPAGRYAEGIIEFMGGLDGCRILKSSGARKAIKELGSNKRLTSDVITELENIIKRVEDRKHTTKDLSKLRSVITTTLPKDTKALSRVQIVRMIRQAQKPEDKELWVGGEQGLEAERCFDLLLSQQIIRPGLTFQCQGCGKREWYTVKEFGEEFQCKYCLHEQPLPNLDKLDWEYKLNGLFSLPNSGEGSIPVCLSLWALQHVLHMDSCKYITCRELMDNTSNRKHEFDFAVIATARWHGGYHLVLGEARDQVPYTKDEIGKLERIASRMEKKPMLCFSALREDFSDEEKKEFKKLTKKGYKVIALTRKELDPYSLHERFKEPNSRYHESLESLQQCSYWANVDKDETFQ